MGYLAQKKELDDMKKTLQSLHDKYADVIKSSLSGSQMDPEEFASIVNDLIDAKLAELPASVPAMAACAIEENLNESKLVLLQDKSYDDNLNTMMYTDRDGYYAFEASVRKDYSGSGECAASLTRQGMSVNLVLVRGAGDCATNLVYLKKNTRINMRKPVGFSLKIFRIDYA